MQIRVKVQEWIDHTKEGRLQKRDLWFLVDVQFCPTVGFGVSYNMASHTKLESALRKQYYQLIPMSEGIWTALMAIQQLHRGF